MILIKVECRKCGCDIGYFAKHEESIIKIIPNECNECKIKNQLNRLENPICDFCGGKIKGDGFAFIGAMKNILIHQECYPGGQEAYFQYCRKEKMEEQKCQLHRK